MTPKQRLVAVLLPGVETDVAELVAEGKSWREVADVVNSRLPESVTISHESLRQWFSSEAVA